jgi:hypothetical protein
MCKQNKSGKWFLFFDGGDEKCVLLFSKKQKKRFNFCFVQRKKKHHLHAIHTLFLRIVSARNLLLSSERDTASGIYAHKEVRAL